MTRALRKESNDRALLNQLLDEVLVGHVGVVRSDGTPAVLPTLIARDGDQLLIHGSTGSMWMRTVAEGALVCVEVTAFDAMVVARSAFESSVHYRSAVLFGSCASLDGDDLLSALEFITDRLIPGRVAEVRPSTRREIASTMVLAMPIEQWSLKVSDDWPDDEEPDVAGHAWAGVVPLLPRAYGDPRPAPDLRAGIGVPASVRGLGAASL